MPAAGVKGGQIMDKNPAKALTSEYPGKEIPEKKEIGIVEALGGERWTNIYAAMLLGCAIISAVCLFVIAIRS